MRPPRHYSLPQLPPMRCDDGCGECCGIVLCAPDEYERIRGVVKVRGIKPVRQGATCPLFVGGRCSVYEVRPMTCRLYGHCEGLTCPRGYNTNVDAETEAAWAKAASDGYSMERARFLHELVYSQREIADILAAELADHGPHAATVSAKHSRAGAVHSNSGTGGASGRADPAHAPATPGLTAGPRANGQGGASPPRPAPPLSADNNDPPTDAGRDACAGVGAGGVFP